MQEESESTVLRLKGVVSGEAEAAQEASLARKREQLLSGRRWKCLSLSQG